MLKTKALSVFLIFTLLIAFLPSGPAIYSSDILYTYTVSEGYATITEYLGPEGDVVIPDSLDGYTINKIGAYAFQNKTEVTGIVIPDSVNRIGKWSFLGCTGLESVTIPNSVTSIGEHAFYNCFS
jgi:hypothetical protein